MRIILLYIERKFKMNYTSMYTIKSLSRYFLKLEVKKFLEFVQLRNAKSRYAETM